MDGRIDGCMNDKWMDVSSGWRVDRIDGFIGWVDE